MKISKRQRLLSRSESYEALYEKSNGSLSSAITIVDSGKRSNSQRLSRNLYRGEQTIQEWITKDDINPSHVQELCEYFGIKEKSLMGDPEELADYKLYDRDKYICTGTLKELSRITGKDSALLKYYIHLNEQGRNAGHLKLERVIEDET